MKNFKGLFDSQILDSLGIKHGTDKTSKHHDYLRKYQFFLESWVNDVFTCLELGVNKGPSLKMWNDFFPKARVVGVDINPSALKYVGDLECRIGDIGDMKFLTSLQNYKPRLIIDDASHHWNHQLSAFFTLFPHLQPGGIYILEDICTSFEPYAAKHRNDEPANPFRVMELLAESLVSQEKTESGSSILALSPPSPYQSLIETIAKSVDCVVFIKFACLIIKKKEKMVNAAAEIMEKRKNFYSMR